jgi:predicted transcriptional regulator
LTVARSSRAGEIHGELQAQLMAVIWRRGEATVEQVREGLPVRYRSAYTTVQTVLNRLAERGLLKRRREGNAIVYSPRLSEAEYLSRSIQTTLAGASSEARQTVLAQLVGGLRGEELSELRRLAKRNHDEERGKR